MKFCPVCHNVLYAIDETTDKSGDKFAEMSCRKCEYKERIDRDNPIVYEHLIRQDKSVRIATNPYLKHDPTLPRFKEIVCPNNSCSTRKSTGDSDVVGIRLDAINLTWLYQCAVCDYTWTQNARAT
jgi:DNA-directed RNA polymerase subunit M/transcription elongation factor TFIIS